MNKKLVCIDGNSNKFWQIETDGSKLTVRYGRVGTDGQISIKEFASPSECEKEANKLIAEKIKKGYQESESNMLLPKNSNDSVVIDIWGVKHKLDIRLQRDSYDSRKDNPVELTEKEIATIKWLIESEIANSEQVRTEIGITAMDDYDFEIWQEEYYTYNSDGEQVGTKPISFDNLSSIICLNSLFIATDGETIALLGEWEPDDEHGIAIVFESKEFNAITIPSDIYKLAKEFIPGNKEYLEGLKLYENDDYLNSIPFFKSAAKLGHVEASLKLGYIYDGGEGVNQDMKEAFKWFMQAAEAGNMDAQYCVGYDYSFGEGVRQDEKLAVEWFEKAALQGQHNAQYYLGFAYLKGEGKEQDFPKALEWFKKSDNKQAEQYIKLLSDAIGEQNYSENNKESEEFATIGYNYEFGIDGYQKDLNKAFENYKKSADMGHKVGQYNLARCYGKGIGCSIDLIKSEEFYLLSVEQGYLNAINNLGCLYEERKEYEKAMELWLKAVEQSNGGHKNALANIADCYKEGNGVKLNYDKAKEYYNKALALDSNYQYAKDGLLDLEKKIEEYLKELMIKGETLIDLSEVDIAEENDIDICSLLAEAWTSELEQQMLTAFVKLYNKDMKYQWGPDGEDAKTYWPEINNPLELLMHIDIDDIYMYSLNGSVVGRDKQRIAGRCVVMQLNCPWDDEHGWAAVFIDEKFIKVDRDIVDCVWLDE